LLKFIKILFKKIKGKSMGYWSQSLFRKLFEWCCSYFLEKRIFLSIAIPKHTSKHTFPKHTSKVTMWYVCMCRCLCRCTSLESIVLYICPSLHAMVLQEFKLHKRNYKIPRSYILSLGMRIEVQEMKLKVEGWNVLMKHEMKMLVA
jgi:hypothetical protein